MRAPIAFIYGNCVFADGPDDPWAAFAVEVSTYAWLSEEGKRAPFLALIGALEAIEADVQIVRVSRRWPLDRYTSEVAQSSPGKAVLSGTAHARVRTRYLEEHVRRLNDMGATQPAVFVLVSLREPERDVASYVSSAATQHPRQWLIAFKQAFSLRDRRLIKVSELEQARVRADQVHARLAGLLSVRPARGVELQWLVRRAYCRGLGEPLVDAWHEPRALAFERNGEAMLAPLEGDVMRWMDGYVENLGRSLKVESELGTSWQAHLVAGALPERMQFPSARAELAAYAEKSADKLGRAERIVVPYTGTDGKMMYRARFGTFPEQEARAICIALTHQGHSCFASMLAR